MPERVRIGTRGSKLALWQANAAADALRAVDTALEVEICVFSTTGDRILDKPLEDIGDKGLFTRELDEALLSGEVDLCVHSMKDLPAELPAGLELGAMLPRADARDALVCGPRIAGAASLAELPAGTRLGTGSQRRTAQLRARFPQLAPLPMRGNVDTRLRKATGPGYEGAVLAAAGLLRMGAEGSIAAFLPVDEMVPAVGQGAIGIVARSCDARIGALCKAIDHAATSSCVKAERLVLAALGGGCHAPIGVYARYVDGSLAFDATVLAPDGSREARVSRRDPLRANPLAVAREVATELRLRGAAEILADARVGEAR